MSEVKPYKKRSIIAAVAVTMLAVSTATVTTAAFTNQITATGTVTGSFDISQGDPATEQHATPETAKVIPVTLPIAGAPIATLPAPPIGEPAVPTAGSVMRIQNNSSGAAASVTFALSNQAAAPVAGLWEKLVFGIDEVTGPVASGAVYPDRSSLLPNATPLAAADIAALQSPATVTIPAGGYVDVLVRMWMSHAAVVSDYGQPVKVALAATGLSVGGEEIPLVVTIP